MMQSRDSPFAAAKTFVNVATAALTDPPLLSVGAFIWGASGDPRDIRVFDKCGGRCGDLEARGPVRLPGRPAGLSTRGD